MTRTVAQLSISLDGFVAGPDQGPDHPFGLGAGGLLDWARHAREPGHEADLGLRDALLRPMGAFVMGRNMFGPVRGMVRRLARVVGLGAAAPRSRLRVDAPSPRIARDAGRHHVRLRDRRLRCRACAGEGGRRRRGRPHCRGASTVRQALRAGAVDELLLDIVPVLLKRGESFLDDVGDVTFEPVEVVHSPYATHVRYRIAR